MARISNPSRTRRRAISTVASLSSSFTEMKARLPGPPVGSALPAAACALAKAAAKSPTIPITSPVDFISGPSIVSTPRKRAKGKTASLTAMCRGRRSPVAPASASVFPTMHRDPALASGRPVAFATKGTVRLARGFTSRT